MTTQPAPLGTGCDIRSRSVGMSFRLRHRGSFDPEAVTTALRLRALRLESPREWDWAWPLHLAEPIPPSASKAAVNSAWVSAVRTVAVSDDAKAIAFVSRDDGRVALLTRRSEPEMACTSLLVPAHVDPLPVATSVAFFSMTINADAIAPQPFVAVGYASGNIGIFEVDTAILLAVTRPVADMQVRRLRIYPAFHLLTAAEQYPAVSSNSGLFAVLAWSGTFARLSLTELGLLLSQARSTGRIAVDQRGAGWVVWKTSVQDAVLDAAVCGSDPSSICEMDIAPPEAPLRIAAAGVNPALAAFTVTADPAFSARDVAKRAASSVFSAARGFLLSRITSVVEPASASAEEERKAVTGVTRFSTSWADNAGSAQSLINFGDVRDTARKSVKAVLTGGRKPMDVDAAAATESHRRSSQGSGHRDQAHARLERQPEGGLSGDTRNDRFSESMFLRQRSGFNGEDVVQIAKLPQNARVIERLAAAPLPCSLLATSDTLGRIFVQDSRDLCVLRILKGYREAQVAWLAQGGPLLAVYAPRLNVLELHGPLDVKRKVAFRLLPGSMLVQSTTHRVFCVSPNGRLHELMRARKEQAGNRNIPSSISQGSLYAQNRGQRPGAFKMNEDASVVLRDDELGESLSDAAAADYELVGVFLEAVKRGQTSTAVDCLQKVESSVVKVAHLMANLVTCAEYIRTEVHVALAGKASQVAANVGQKDLVSRFEAHGRLAEAFALLAAEAIPGDTELEKKRLSRYGHRLLEDGSGAGLAEFAVEEMSIAMALAGGKKRMRSSSSADEMVNCERFILSHALVPSTDLRTDLDYTLAPRRGLSAPEKVWLSRAYFARLLEVDSAGVPTQGREHPTTRDIFLALTDFVGLSYEEITKQFATYILNAPLLALLNTHVAMHASPIRCALGRIRGRFPLAVVDPVLMEECETSTRIPNATLLMRLCSQDERLRSSKQEDGVFAGSLNRLEEVLLYRKLIADSEIPRTLFEGFTGRKCTGVPGDAERQAVRSLIEWNDFNRASKILTGLEVSNKRQSLEWHESASVSEAALHACRKKSISLMAEDNSAVIPASVVAWVRAAEAEQQQPEWEHLIEENGEDVLRQLRAVLLSAHPYFPDSSVDAVRCLQLAEAMSALIELEVTSKAREGGSATAAQGNTDKATGDGIHEKSQRVDDVDNFRPVPTVPHESQDGSDMADMLAVPVVSQDPSEMDVDDAIDVDADDVVGIDAGDVIVVEDDGCDEVFFDLPSAPQDGPVDRGGSSERRKED